MPRYQSTVRKALDFHKPKSTPESFVGYDYYHCGRCGLESVATSESAQRCMDGRCDSLRWEISLAESDSY